MVEDEEEEDDESARLCKNGGHQRTIGVNRRGGEELLHAVSAVLSSDELVYHGCCLASSCLVPGCLGAWIVCCFSA
jgi:hypothetical protein